MNESISDLKNPGPKRCAWLNEFGVYAHKDIPDFGAAGSYNMLQERGYPVTIVLAYALQGAIMDRHRDDLPEDVSLQLRIECTFNR